jgi:hypothetical protein
LVTAASTEKPVDSMTRSIAVNMHLTMFGFPRSERA